jgi:PPIC-type PPIASE domain/SurA N-terminal domain
MQRQAKKKHGRPCRAAARRCGEGSSASGAAKPSRGARLGLGVALAVGALAALGACGGASKERGVVRVGHESIAGATVRHWANVLARGGTFSGFRSQARGTARQKALALLISSSWLVGEAARQGLAVSDGAVDRALKEREQADGEAEFEEGLAASGQTKDDVKLELRAELATAAIRHELAGRAASVTDAEVQSFYAANRGLFRTPQERDVDLIENLPSRSAATALVARIGGGARFAKRAYHEALSRTTGELSGTREKRGLINSIYAAQVGAVSQPMPLNHGWTVFVVRTITPARFKALAQVRAEIVSRLTARRRRELVASFERGYRVRWTARTSCRTGYVVQGCMQYAGATVPEQDQFAAE